jgi:hypothetical protein
MTNADAALATAERSGALIRYRVPLEQGELDNRRLWLRPDIDKLIKSGILDQRQTEVVRAASRRYIVGGLFTVVTAACTNREVASVGDLRELKGKPPPFIEVRFKPPKHDLRFFGRFIGKDGLVLTTYGMKSHSTPTGQRRLSIPEERKRCDDVFRALNLRLDWVPARIRDSISNASFV